MSSCCNCSCPYDMSVFKLEVPYGGIKVEEVLGGVAQDGGGVGRCGIKTRGSQ